MPCTRWKDMPKSWNGNARAIPAERDHLDAIARRQPIGAAAQMGGLGGFETLCDVPAEGICRGPELEEAVGSCNRFPCGEECADGIRKASCAFEGPCFRQGLGKRRFAPMRIQPETGVLDQVGCLLFGDGALRSHAVPFTDGPVCHGACTIGIARVLRVAVPVRAICCRIMSIA